MGNSEENIRRLLEDLLNKLQDVDIREIRLLPLLVEFINYLDRLDPNVKKLINKIKREIKMREVINYFIQLDSRVPIMLDELDPELKLESIKRMERIVRERIGNLIEAKTIYFDNARKLIGFINYSRICGVIVDEEIDILNNKLMRQNIILNEIDNQITIEDRDAHFIKVMRALKNDAQDIICLFSSYIDELYENDKSNRLYLSKDMCKFVILMKFLEDYFRFDFEESLVENFLKLYDSEEEIEKDIKFGEELQKKFFNEKHFKYHYKFIGKHKEGLFHFKIPEINFESKLTFRDYFEKKKLNYICENWTLINNDNIRKNQFWFYQISKESIENYNIASYFPYLRMIRTALQQLEIKIENYSFKNLFELFVIAPNFIEILTKTSIKELEKNKIIASSRKLIGPNGKMIDILETLKQLIKIFGAKLKAWAERKAKIMYDKIKYMEINRFSSSNQEENNQEEEGQDE
ncbi:MAG: hypothetical protein ACFFAN_11825 [Promethearchaeota archaeon]